MSILCWFPMSFKSTPTAEYQFACKRLVILCNLVEEPKPSSAESCTCKHCSDCDVLLFVRALVFQRFSHFSHCSRARTASLFVNTLLNRMDECLQQPVVPWHLTTPLASNLQEVSRNIPSWRDWWNELTCWGVDNSIRIPLPGCCVFPAVAWLCHRGLSGRGACAAAPSIQMHPADSLSYFWLFLVVTRCSFLEDDYTEMSIGLKCKFLSGSVMQDQLRHSTCRTGRQLSPIKWRCFMQRYCHGKGHELVRTQICINI